MSAAFTSVIVLEEAIRPGTEDIGFYAQMTAADTRVEETESVPDDDYSFEKRVRLDANHFYQVQIRILPVADWEPDDGWRTVFITSVYDHAIERLSKEPGRDADNDDLPF